MALVVVADVVILFKVQGSGKFQFIPIGMDNAVVVHPGVHWDEDLVVREDQAGGRIERFGKADDPLQDIKPAVVGEVEQVAVVETHEKFLYRSIWMTNGLIFTRGITFSWTGSLSALRSLKVDETKAWKERVDCAIASPFHFFVQQHPLFLCF